MKRRSSSEAIRVEKHPSPVAQRYLYKKPSRPPSSKFTERLEAAAQYANPNKRKTSCDEHSKEHKDAMASAKEAGFSRFASSFAAWEQLNIPQGGRAGAFTERGDDDTRERCCSVFRWRGMTLCLLLGTCTAIIDYAITHSIDGMFSMKTTLIDNSNDDALKLLLFTLFTVAAVIFALVWTYNVSPAAIGSGIPQLRAILIGFNLRDYLSIRTFVCKIVGVVAVLGSGLMAGKEGPFVHLSSIICNQLFRLPFLRAFGDNPITRKEFLAAAAAGGIASSFGAPVGGVLFSVEVTSTHYLSISSYIKGFTTALFGAVVSQVLRTDAEDRLDTRFVTEFSWEDVGPSEFIPFLVLGVFGGLTGALFVRLTMGALSFRERLQCIPFIGNPYVFSVFIGLITALTTFPFRTLVRNSAARLSVDTYFAGTDLEDASVEYLLLEAVLILVLTALTITLPVPVGMFIPVYTSGALFGRAFGLLMESAFPSLNVVAGGYALVGAAALFAGVTRSISTAVISVEVTGQLVYLLPVMIGVVVSSQVGDLLSDSIYDAMSRKKNLPYLPGSRHSQGLVAKKVRSIMNEDVRYVTVRTTHDEIEALLQSASHSVFPVVSDEEVKMLVGLIHRSDLDDILHNFRSFTALARTAERLEHILPGGGLTPSGSPELTIKRLAQTSNGGGGGEESKLHRLFSSNSLLDRSAAADTQKTFPEKLSVHNHNLTVRVDCSSPDGDDYADDSSEQTQQPHHQSNALSVEGAHQQQPQPLRPLSAPAPWPSPQSQRYTPHKSSPLRPASTSSGSPDLVHNFHLNDREGSPSFVNAMDRPQSARAHDFVSVRSQREIEWEREEEESKVQYQFSHLGDVAVVTQKRPASDELTVVKSPKDYQPVGDSDSCSESSESLSRSQSHAARRSRALSDLLSPHINEAMSDAESDGQQSPVVAFDVDTLTKEEFTQGVTTDLLSKAQQILSGRSSPPAGRQNDGEESNGGVGECVGPSTDGVPNTLDLASSYPIDLLSLDFRFGLLDRCPLQMSDRTNVLDAVLLFTALRREDAMVTRYGRLVGILSKEKVFHHV